MASDSFQLTNPVFRGIPADCDTQSVTLKKPMVSALSIPTHLNVFKTQERIMLNTERAFKPLVWLVTIISPYLADIFIITRFKSCILDFIRFYPFVLILEVYLTKSFLFPTVWSETELNFLYHPQLLQVQITTKGTEDKPPRSKQVATLKPGGGRKGSRRGFTNKRNQILKRPKNTLIGPTETWKRSNPIPKRIRKILSDLKPEVCAYSTALTKHTSQRCS